MSFLRGDLLARMRLLMKGGIREKPKWFDAVRRIPPQPITQRCKKAPAIVFPEDPFVESYYARHPEAKLQHPFSLLSFDPPIARRFAWRQLELLPQAREQVLREAGEDFKEETGREMGPEDYTWEGWDERRAREIAREMVEEEFEAARIAEEEMALAQRRLAIRAGKEPPPRKQNMLDEIQDEEWQSVVNGLEVIGSEKLEKKGRL